MKSKIFIVLLMTLILSATLSAQTEKGQWIIGGNASLDVTYTEGGLSNQSGKSGYTVLNITPEAGYFVFDNFSAGLSGNYAYRWDFESEDMTLLSQFKYYLSQSNCRPFVKANVGYRYASIYGNDGSLFNSKDMGGVVFGGGIGCAFFVSRTISIDLGVQYLHSHLTQMGNTYDLETDRTFDFTANKNDVNVFVGFSLYL
ncbi:MAG TPA: hypothetical protein DDZ96_08505 [Porphyromonadaceae bacterium]|jgi:outer membrane protein|nr:hypothetical protein [Porphyromonadaceae bacterium]HBL33846.1 hypothetical protein [Porphyromonadaceae bacterium]HCM19309.1 hypothetical protein [Porphyromonadaceae bacterium]